MTRKWIRIVLLGTLSGCMASASQATTEEHRVWVAAAKHVLANESTGTEKVGQLSVFERTSFPGLAPSVEQLLLAAKNGFCGLPPAEAEATILKLRKLSAGEESVRKVFAEHREFKVTAERPNEGDYLGLSKVLFSPDKRSAFFNLDIGGVSGSIVVMRFENGEWTKLEECAQWTSY
jgi:hypothetical protein